MKPRTALTLLLLLVCGAASALDSGYYRIISYNSKYLTENTNSHALICSDLSESNYAQVWYLNVSGTSVTFKNVLTERYMQKTTGNAWSEQYVTGTSSNSFTLNDEGNGIFTFTDKWGAGPHCDAALNVVLWVTSEDKSKWTFAVAEVDASALAAQKAAISEATTSQLTQFFTTTACTELKSAYVAMSDANLRNAMKALPATVQEMAVKVKNNAWQTYNGWDKTEFDFRIASHKAYSSPARWTGIIGLGYSFGRLTNPTGISASTGEYIHVYVGAIPSGQTIKLEVAGDNQAAGSTYTLKQGMNVLLMASSGNCFVNYEVDNTNDGKAPYTNIDSYAPVTVHIEGGTVNGYFDLTKGDDNSDWANLQTHLLTGSDNVEIKTDHLLFHMNTALVKAACPTKMVELLGEWEKILCMEYSLMGLESFDGKWNNMLSATDITGDSYMYATTYGTYYNVTTLSSVMSYADMFSGGAIWGPAHENGHLFQKYINMVGQTEVSNNLFSNVAVYNNGHLTSRATFISTTFEGMAQDTYWNDRGIWERTHLYFQLYQFFHILGIKPDFYPELFKALRSDPMPHTGNTFISAADDYLKFYKKCCSVSGYDLTEFFQAYGFFVIPTLTSYTLNGVTKDAYKVGDYGDYYLTVTQEEIDAAMQAVAAMNLPKANIIFIEDRIKAPAATYEGAAAGEKKVAFSNEYPIGQAGETGQYTDFGATCSAYQYNVKNGKVTMGGTGAVGFKVYDSTGKLCGLYNTKTFTLPDGIGTGYTIKAAAGNGTDIVATYTDETIDTSDIIDLSPTYPDVSKLADKTLNVAGEAAETLETGRWYVMFDRGKNHGYLYENASNKLYNTATAPSTDANKSAKYLVRIVKHNGACYLQTGLGNYFGKIQQSTNVPTTKSPANPVTLKKIANTDGHYTVISAEGVVLDANNLQYGDATVVGWGTTVPTTTGGNNDWAFYPVAIMGDVNGDGEVDLSDAIMVTYYSLHQVPAKFIEAAADMNGDREIDLSDAIIIIYKSLGVK